MRGFAALALACAASLAQASSPAPPDLAAVVKARLGEAETPACIAVGLVGDTNRMEFGCTPGTGPRALDERSIFEIGSITKAFTGILLADMVRKGEVTLDDEVSRYARPGSRLPLRGEKALTLRDLVTHTSGLPRIPPKFTPSNPRNPYADFDEERLYEALAATEIRGRLNNYEYSNFGFMWLSDLLGRRAGKPYDALLSERVLDPLGMGDTAVTLRGEQAKRFVAGHHATGSPAGHWDFVPGLAGVGGLRSSLADMMRLAAALAGRADTPLKESLALALAPLRPATAISSTGFAWTTYERNDKVHFHNGGTGGFRSMIAVNTATRTAAVVLVDSETSFDDLALHLVDPQLPLAKKRVALATDAATLNQYVGRYQLTPAFAIDVYVESGALMAQATAQAALTVFREGPDLFYYTVVPAKLRFSRGPDGQVDGLTLEQGGRELKGKRGPSTR